MTRVRLFALAVLACSACLADEVSSDVGDTDTGTTEVELPEGWSELELELDPAPCTLDVEPAQLAWLWQFPADSDIGPLVEDGHGGVVLVGSSGERASVVDLGFDGAITWARTYTTQDTLRAKAVDASAEGRLAVVGSTSDQGAPWLWSLDSAGTPIWTTTLASSDDTVFVAVAGDEVVTATESGFWGRHALSDGEKIYATTWSMATIYDLVADTSGGAWTSEIVNVGFLGPVPALSHYGPDGGWIADVDSSGAVDEEIFALDHDEDGDLAFAGRFDGLMRVLLARGNGDIGGQQSLPYDYGDVVAISLGPDDDLIVAFENTLVAYDTSANELWRGTLDCGEAPVVLGDVDLDREGQTWVTGHIGVRSFVARIDPG